MCLLVVGSFRLPLGFSLRHIPTFIGKMSNHFCLKISIRLKREILWMIFRGYFVCNVENCDLYEKSWI